MKKKINNFIEKHEFLLELVTIGPFSIWALYKGFQIAYAVMEPFAPLFLQK